MNTDHRTVTNHSHRPHHQQQQNQNSIFQHCHKPGQRQPTDDSSSFGEDIGIPDDVDEIDDDVLIDVDADDDDDDELHLNNNEEEEIINIVEETNLDDDPGQPPDTNDNDDDDDDDDPPAHRLHEPPKSLQLDRTTAERKLSSTISISGARHNNNNNVIIDKGGKLKRLDISNEIGVFDFDINFDSDEAEDIIDYSIYENKTGLAEDMKFLASMPELCDITFLVGETREPVCAVKAVLASRSRVFHKLLYGQKQQPSLTTGGGGGGGIGGGSGITGNNNNNSSKHNNNENELKNSKRKESQRDTKLKLFLKRSSEPILNGLPFNQQQPSVQTHQTMIIEEFEPDVFRQLIEYIHTGCVTLQARTLLGLMNAADYYGLEELRRACIGFVTCCITVDTVNSILASAERYIQYKCTKSLVQRVLEFVDKHGNEVLSLGSFAMLPEHVVRLILSREELKADELTKFQAALHWSQRSCDSSCGTLDLRDVMANFLECIEFYKIPASVLMREVHPLGVVPDHIIMNALAFQADPSSVDIRKVESPNRFRRMTLPHAFNIAGSDLIHLRHTANFWAERAEAAAAGGSCGKENVSDGAGTGNKDGGNKKEKLSSRLSRRRASKPFKRSKTLMESS